MRTIQEPRVTAVTPAASGGAVTTTPGAVGPLVMAQPGGGLRRHFAALRDWAPFLLIVAMPTLLAGIYFGLIAADRYVAEVRFVVRSAERSSMGGVGAFLQGAGIGAAPGDAYLVRDFIESRDALAELDARVGLRAMMGRDEADFVARWPNPIEGDSFEALHDYYGRRVRVTHDVTSGVSKLTVEAFAPEDAQRIATALLEQSEAFVNRMNDRAMADTVEMAQAEVRLAEDRVRENQRVFAAFRERERLVSPVSDSEAQMELIARLSGERARLQAAARRLEREAASSPQLPALRARIAATDAQIAAERDALVGRDDALTGRYGEFESLVLEQEFSADALLLARGALEQARAEALRKQRYLETVVGARAPDEARQPARLLSVLSVAATTFLLYAVGWLLWVNAREHAS